MLAAHALQPVGPAPAGGHHRVTGAQLVGALGALRRHARAGIAVHEHLSAGGAEAQVHARVDQVALQARVQLARPLRAQVAQRAVHELEARLDGAQTYAVHLRARAGTLHAAVGAERQIHAVHLPDGRLHGLVADEVGQIAAHLARQRQLAVRERARAREPRGDAARLAAEARPARLLGARAVLHGQPLVQHDDAPCEPALDERERAEDAGGAGPHDDDVGVLCAHGAPPSLPCAAPRPHGRALPAL